MRLVVDKLTLYIGKQKLIGPLSFTLEKGSSLGILGASGSGKSTLLKAICGLHKNYTGTIAIENFFPKGKQYPIQMVFQDSLASLHPKLTVYETLHEAIQVKGGSTFSLEEVFELVHLDKEHFYCYPHELSGGQRQRVSIARALLASPDVIALDECTSALDLLVEKEILALLKQVQKQTNCALLVVSHSKKVIDALCEEKIELFSKEQELWTC